MKERIKAQARVTKLSIMYWDALILSVVGALLGVVVGAIDAIFGRVLIAITAFREANISYLLPFLALAGFIIVFVYKNYGKNIGRGMNLVFDVGEGKENKIPIRLIPFLMGCTWLTHLFGGSVGKEGAAVQMGAAFAYEAGKRIPVRNAENIFLITGMAAGFAGLFRTPMAAVFFAMEVIVAGKMEYKALAPVFTASFAAYLTSGLCGLPKFEFIIPDKVTLDFENVLKLAVLGIIFGLVGGAFTFFLKHTKKFIAKKITNPYIRVLILGVCLSALFLLLWKGRYSGLSTNLMVDSLSSGTKKIYPWDWALKFILTILTISAGFQGGEVTPLFVIGSTLGVWTGALLGFPTSMAAGLGCAAVFGSATNTVLAPVFIGAEIFGYQNLPYFFVVCVVAYIFNTNQSIYSAQKIVSKRKLRRKNINEK